MKRNTSPGRASSRFLVVAVAALLVAAIAPGTAAAHDLKMMVISDERTIRVEAWFDGDIPAESARVTVTDAVGETVLTGTTDDRGVWSFPKPGPGVYRIAVEQTGHRSEARLAIPNAAAGEPVEAPAVTGDPRLNQKLGLALGLTMLLGGTVAFALIRLKRKPVPAAESTS